ncbi:methionine--tRNA ligase, partial [Candidatus Uhrbacteria bacterium]|nr:methionine--tRNA ligase [Candidatus Uhrbacteria bacterium]
TGTDEHSQKNVEAAERAGESDIQAYVDRMSAVWQSTFDSLQITNDDFIRTSEERHKIGVRKFWQAVSDRGDIYLGTYAGWYCVGCEAFITEADLEEGNCPIHKKSPQRIEEQNYFFRLTKYRDALLAYVDTHPDFIQPESRRNEVRSYIQDFMTDVSISRQSMKWGISVPEMSNDKFQISKQSQVIYVWFDALINYLTGIGYGTDEEKFERFWPADVHLVGKDIIKFHCALWPAMLMSAGISLPRRVFAHGFFTVNGVKMSKSLGNVVDPLAVAAQYDLDTLRYYLFRDISFGEDGDFSFDRLADRYNHELANELGNLVGRVTTMTEKYCRGKVPRPASGQAHHWSAYHGAMERLAIHEALETVWSLVREANRMVDSEAPWKLAEINQERLEAVMYTLLETLRQIAWMLLPLLPLTAERIFDSLGYSLAELSKQSLADAEAWGGLPSGQNIKKIPLLFPKKKLAQ